MILSRKIAYGVAFGLVANFALAQSVQQGINNIDSHKYAQAKQNFEQMLSKDASAENYFYNGNVYLTQFQPNFAKAKEYFDKGLAADKRSNLNKIGLASIKLGRGDKSGIAEIQSAVKDSREKDSEILYRAAEALTLFEKASNPDLAIEYLDKAIERERKEVPTNYYYTLGDAYRLKLTNSPQVAGSAMTAYDKALPSAKNKASVFTRIGTLWMAAQQWQKAKESLDKAVLSDATYAPAYKALAAYNIKYQNNGEATQNLINYAKNADEDPYTQLEIAKLFFINDDYANSKVTLDKVFDKVDDPIKYKLKSFLQYADGMYPEALASLNTFMSQADKSTFSAGDQGLMGLISAGLAKNETDESKKTLLMNDAMQKVAIAKAAKDETMDWDMELAKIKGGGADMAAANAGATTPEIEALKKKIAANPKDVESIVALGTAYTQAENYDGAIIAWDKMIAVAPDYTYSYYAKGAAYQLLQNNDMAEASYQKYIDMVRAQPVPEQMKSKEALSYAYYLVAFFKQDKDLATAKDYAQQAVNLNPTYEPAVTLNTALMAK
ncbi:tetratricopeptide repeat protein [Frigoriflavimonas asaccharolytica]|uniref:Tetratricopeptide (TPR) repeat protein n=1 Tax=Frigoriflavimonas asaccharolytica TaxID=2735899 RepID=A0A8J8G984_9FLAO|nr:hypothetical protein [Frigoriflavimonas asaccharolytica]NRS93458.1 tetratricopeptide (TPR) repeat protein [Frigoriflavimonas asaccharolytica]